MKTKKTFLIAFTVILGLNLVQGQNEKNTWGLKGGLNFPMNGFSFNETGENIGSIFTGEDNSTGWHAGLFGRAYAGENIYFGSSLLFLQNESQLYGQKNDETFYETINQTGSQLDLIAGVELLNFLRLNGGVNGLMYFDKSWNQSFDTFGAGYTFGAGVDIWKITIDLSYNGAFKENKGSWQGIPLSYKRSDLMLSVGFKF